MGSILRISFMGSLQLGISYSRLLSAATTTLIIRKDSITYRTLLSKVNKNAVQVGRNIIREKFNIVPSFMN